MAMIGEFEHLVEVRERVPIPNGGAGRQGRPSSTGFTRGWSHPAAMELVETDGGAAGEHDRSRARRAGGSQQQPNDHAARPGPPGEESCGREASRSPTVVKERAADRRPPAGLLELDGAPAASSWALAFSASSLEAFSRTGCGALSTRSLASFSPRLVSARTSLMTLIFLSPAAVMTRRTGPSRPRQRHRHRHRPRGCRGGCDGRSRSDTELSSKSFSSSLSSRTDMSAIAGGSPWWPCQLSSGSAGVSPGSRPQPLPAGSRPQPLQAQGFLGGRRFGHAALLVDQALSP